MNNKKIATASMIISAILMIIYLVLAAGITIDTWSIQYTRIQNFVLYWPIMYKFMFPSGFFYILSVFFEFKKKSS